jgi:hypothetical protein
VSAQSSWMELFERLRDETEIQQFGEARGRRAKGTVIDWLPRARKAMAYSSEVTELARTPSHSATIPAFV